MAVDELGDEIIDPNPRPNQAEERIKQLSDKVRLTAEERDEKDRLLKEESEKRQEIERERDFFQGFSDIVSEHPAAKDHREDILAKVKTGYTVEDATYAVLGKVGKLSKPAEAPVEPEHPAPVAGGSASTSPQSGGEKTLADMSREEKLAQLRDAEARGDLGLS